MKPDPALNLVPQMSAPLVSIIMPCYKMGRFIGEALDSVGRQSHENWEVIAVDDCGPEDGTKEIVASFAARYPEQRIVYHHHPVNRGVSAARNTAINFSKGAYLAFLDPDDRWLPNHLELQVELRNQRPGVVVSCGPVKMFSKGQASGDMRVWGLSDFEIGNFPLSLVIRNGITPSAVVVERSAIVRVGGFDTATEIQHVEDWDLWIRLAEDGASFAFVDEITVEYRKHSDAATADAHAMDLRLQALIAKHQGFWLSSSTKLSFQMFQQIEKLEEFRRDLAGNPLLRVGRFLSRFRNRLAFR
jgi:glycosyltransferase involved in cell wall biosynthesis